MRYRSILISLAFIVGLLLTVSGAAMAVTGPSALKDPALAQYGGDDDDDGRKDGDDDDGDEEDDNGDDDDDDGQVATLGGPPPGPPPGPPVDTGPPPSGGEIPDEGGEAPEGGVAPAGGGGGRLPFTGFAAIPILILGMALLTLGVIGRRRLRTDQALS